MRVVAARRPSAMRAARPAVPAPLPPLPAVQLPATMQLGRFSRAEGPWQVDWRRAHTDAQAALDAIDFSKPEIMLWIPGTDGKGVLPVFDRAVRYVYGDG